MVLSKTGSKLLIVIALTLSMVIWLRGAAGNDYLLAKTVVDDQELAHAGLAIPETAASIDITVDEIIASGFSRPVQVTHAGDGSGRLFVVEQDGRIKIIKNGSTLATPFLDINTLVRSPSDGSGNSERGLLGLAFHPNYAANGYFYLNYTNNGGHTTIVRYSVSANPDIADAGSAGILLTVAQFASNHNGGQLLFSPIDGYLYIGMGDGGSGGDPGSNGQNKATLLGAMLRIDVDSGPGNAPDCALTPSGYTIPTTNPFVDGAGGTCDEIWAIGLRNPWRFSFDRLTGDIYIGDVGQVAREEVSYQAAGTAAGVNFGWDCREGSIAYTGPPDSPAAACSSPGPLTDPITDYDRSLGTTVTGGFVYRGSLYPDLVGHYFFADYGSGRIWSMYKTGPSTWSSREEEIGAGFSISAFGEDESGELYVVEYFNGRIRHLADVNGASPNVATSQKSASTAHADPGEAITYTIKLINSNGPLNQSVSMTDTIPMGLGYISGTLSSTQGTANIQDQTISWQGPLTPSATITITYVVTATGVVTGILTNQAQLTGPTISPITLTYAVLVPRPTLTTTVKDFFFPGTQPNQLDVSIPNPNVCGTCHTEPIYDRWRGSMMAQAGRDPLLWAALAVANADAPGAGEFCLRCHTPKGWLAGRSEPANGSALHSEDISAGVACEVCHRMVDPVPSASDEAVAVDATIRSTLAPTFTLPVDNVGSAMMIIDPEDRRRGPFSVTAPHAPTLQTDFLAQSTNAITESRLCGSCHNINNPVLSWDAGRNQYWPNGSDLAAPSFNAGDLFPIETTYTEWLNSTYAISGVVAPGFAGNKPDGIVSSCQDCHMPRVTGIAATGGVNRDCSPAVGCLPRHDLVGGNTWVPQILQDTRWRLNAAEDSVRLDATVTQARAMLQRAATVTVTLGISGADQIATVRVTNETGHKLPTGYTEGRRLWINLKAYNAAGSLIYESGAYDPASALLTEDAAIKIYESKQGITAELATFLGPEVAAGESFHFVLNNTVILDNRIPPRGFTTAALAQPGLKPVDASYAAGQYWDDTIYPVPAGTVRVLATLYYQTASNEYIDFLRTKGGLDGQSLGMLWDSSKSPPEVMAIAFHPAIPTYLPILVK